MIIQKIVLLKIIFPRANALIWGLSAPGYILYTERFQRCIAMAEIQHSLTPTLKVTNNALVSVPRHSFNRRI